MECLEYSLKCQGELENFCNTMYNALGLKFEPETIHSDYRNINEVYKDPGGAFWVLKNGITIIGTIGLKIIDREAGIGEVKRFFVLPEYQSKGYGRLMIGKLIDYAKKKELPFLRLDTILRAEKALTLYRSLGFYEVSRYNDNTHSEIYMELKLFSDVRKIRYEELPKLMNLYKQLHPDDPEVHENERLSQLWDEIYNDPNLHYIIIEEGGEIVVTCNVSIIKNLTRGLRPYGLIENVITHKDYRKRGYGTRVLHKAIEIAKENGCYKVMIMTSSKSENTLRFYEKAGFSKGVKTGFIINL